MLVALGLSLAVAAVPTVASASIGLGTVVSANPANVTPNVASGAVHELVQVGGTMYAGGAFSSVSTPAGVSPGGTFARGNIVAFNATTGVVGTTFAPSVNGEVWALASDGTSLWIGGTFTSVNGTARRGVAKLNPATGANTGYLNLSISGSVTANAGPVEVYRFAVNPAGTRLVAVGNFTSVGGQTRYRAFMLTLGATSGTVNAWYYPPLQNLCRAGSLPDYMRDVDFSPDGSWFAFVSTGFIPQPGGVGRDLCDAAARFETNSANPASPTWINYTGGDTLHSVAATDAAVYVQGHQRWLNNPQGSNAPGPGAVSRPGIGAINPSTGLALAWNPTKERGVGGKDLYVTSQDLWVGSDTNRIGGETP
jgi:hypothetical protein